MQNRGDSDQMLRVNSTLNDSTAEPLAVASGCHGQPGMENEFVNRLPDYLSVKNRYALKLTVASAGYRERFCS